MTKTLNKWTNTMSPSSIGIALFTLTMGLFSLGCGGSPAVTDQDEITRFLQENPEAQKPSEETSDLKSNEYKGVVRTPEKV